MPRIVAVALFAVLAAPAAAGPAVDAAGLTLADLAPAQLDALKAEAGYRIGVLVTAVQPGSPAAAAGLRAGDVIGAVGKQGVDSAAGVEAELAKPAAETSLLVLRRDAGGRLYSTPLPLRPAAPPPAGAGRGPTGRTYRHPLGATFWHPADWAVADGGQALVLTPPDARTGEETYLITAESLAGTAISSVTDPAVGAYLDQQVAALGAAFRRLGPPSALRGAERPVAIHDYEAAGAGGAVVRARAYVALVEGYGLALLAIGVRDRVLAREGVLGRIAASFGFSQGKVDPALVGVWDFLSTVSIRNDSPFENDWSRARMASDRRVRMWLGADGTFKRAEIRHTIAGAGGVWVDSGEQRTEEKGRFSAADGRLYLVWEDGTVSAFGYRVDAPAGAARTVRLAGDAEGQVWEEAK